jgi:DNA-binding NarL/FixJ family response regulator
MRQRTDKLTTRERQVLELVAIGLRNREIARELCIAEATVENHLHSVFEKLGVTNRVQAARLTLIMSDPYVREK